MLDLRAVSLIEDGAHAEAAPLLTEAIALLPAERALWLHRALARTGMEMYPEALSDLERCVQMDGARQDADVHFLCAKLSLLSGDLAAARRSADAARKLEPGHAEASDLLETMASCADVYTEEATKLILLGAPEDAVTNITHAMDLQPDDPSLLMRRGAAKRQQGKLFEAVGDLEKALERAGGKYPECARLLFLTFNDLGVRLATRGLPRDALPWFDRAIRATDHTEECEGAFFLNRGDCYRSLGEVDASLADFERAAELYAGDDKAQWAIQSRVALVHNERGTQLFNHAAPRHAAVEFSRAIECNPKVGAFYVNRARATLELGGTSRKGRPRGAQDQPRTRTPRDAAAALSCAL